MRDRSLRGGTPLGALATLLVASVVLPAFAQAPNRPVPWTEVVLETGNRLEGRIVKETDGEVFVDVGYTILAVPRTAIREIRTPEEPSETDDPAAAEGESELAADRRDSIFFTAELDPGPIDEKAREVSESVVQVLCLGGSGSGFVVDDEEGYIVTNYHVIEQERDVSVVVYVREPAGLRKVKIDDLRIVALNPFFDLALLKVEDPASVPLRKAYLGDYLRVRSGDPVFAIGNPLGLDRTVSDGIVSNRKRAMGGMLAIQTTAPINPGNSGGPLFNDRGEVIGVTSSKMIGGESLGFAIPVHYVKDFLRNRDAFAFDKDNPNTGVRYFRPPPKSPRAGSAADTAADRSEDL